jgi:hypothetical protein
MIMGIERMQTGGLWLRYAKDPSSTVSAQKSSKSAERIKQQKEE